MWGVNRWGEPGSRKMYGDHFCSPREGGDELGAGWLWATGMVGLRSGVWEVAREETGCLAGWYGVGGWEEGAVSHVGVRIF